MNNQKVEAILGQQTQGTAQLRAGYVLNRRPTGVLGCAGTSEYGQNIREA